MAARLNTIMAVKKAANLNLYFISVVFLCLNFQFQTSVILHVPLKLFRFFAFCFIFAENSHNSSLNLYPLNVKRKQPYVLCNTLSGFFSPQQRHTPNIRMCLLLLAFGFYFPGISAIISAISFNPVNTASGTVSAFSRSPAFVSPESTRIPWAPFATPVFTSV